MVSESEEVKATHDDSKQSGKPTPSNTPGVLVLQWLTYAFWGWLVVGLIWLMSVVLINAITETPVNDVIPYAIAASLVLLPLAFITDLFYRKHEPLQKTGAATVIMIIHAVIFALLSIAALIVSVFTGINALINIDTIGSDSTLAAVLTAVFAAVAYGITFLRTLNPFRHKKWSLVYALTLLGIALTLIIAAFAGPIVSTLATRNDRRVERALYQTEYAISDYIRTNNELPKNLSDIEINDELTREVLDEGRITYVPEASAPLPKVDKEDAAFPALSTREYLRYQLCTTYSQESKDDARYSGYSRYSYEQQDDGYASSLRVTPHKSGKVCYKLQEMNIKNTPSVDVRRVQ